METFADFFLIACSTIAGGIAGCLTAAHLLRRWENFMRAFQRDEAIFARVVRQFYQDDPVLTHGVWKKVYPDVVPPWHQEAARKEN